MQTGFWWGSLREGDHLESRGLNGRIILKRILKTGMGGKAWIDMMQDKNMQQALVNQVMNPQVP